MNPRRTAPLVLIVLLFGAAALRSAQTADEFMASAKTKSAGRDRFGAIADLDRAIALQPDLAAAYLQRANARIAAIDVSDMPVFNAPPPPIDNKTLYAGAISDFGRAIALNPNFAEAYKARALARSFHGPYDRNNLPAILADYDEAVRLDPSDAESYYQRALHRGGMGDQAGSEADIERALAINPNYGKALELRVQSRRFGKDFVGALADLDRAIAALPREDPAAAAAFKAKRPGSPTPAEFDLAALFSLRSSIKRQADDIDGALADIDHAMAIYPKNGYNYASRGSLRQEKGDLVGAVADYATYKELTGDHAGTRAKVVIQAPSGERTPGPARPANAVHLYLYFALCRLQSGSAVMELRPIVAEWREGWLKTAGLYLSGGGVSEADLLTSATQGDAPTVTRQQCQAFYYVGMRRLITNQPSEAKMFFARSLATGQKDLTEYRFARAELAQLAATRPTPADLKP